MPRPDRELSARATEREKERVEARKVASAFELMEVKSLLASVSLSLFGTLINL